MKIDRTGCTRIVILTHHFAFKLPNFLDGFRLFLHGLLANLQESAFGKANYEGLCPVLFAVPFGLLIVMPRARVFTDEEFLAFDYEKFVYRKNYKIPAENKKNSFAWLNGKIVAIDYGN